MKGRVARVVAVALCALAVTGAAWAGTEYQNFNTAPSDWEARAVTGSTYSDITGWSNTNYAGTAVGEGHAKFHRVTSTTDQPNENVAWYADRNLGGTLDVASLRILSASGQFYVNDFASYPDLGTGIWLGWFRPGGGCRMGIMMNDNGAGLGWYAGIYNNWGQLIGQTFMGSVAKGLKYNFNIEFDNLEGVYGQGRLVAQLTPQGQSTETAVIHLTSALANYEFSAFGLARPNPGAYAPYEYKAIDMYMDNLAYTSNLNTPVVTPEPSSMLALASGLFGMVGLAVRRRK